MGEACSAATLDEARAEAAGRTGCAAEEVGGADFSRLAGDALCGAPVPEEAPAAPTLEVQGESESGADPEGSAKSEPAAEGESGADPEAGVDSEPEAEDEAAREAAARKRREDINDLLSETFDSVMRIEERSLDNRLTQGLTINEIHTLVAVGMYEQNCMSEVASRMGVTLATLTKVVNKLVSKGYIERARDESDRRKVLLSLTKRGREVVRVHDMFHRRMIDEALGDLSEEEEIVLASSLTKIKAFFDRQ